MQRFSSVGKKQLAAHGVLFVLNIVVLGVSARVNEFQEFFFAADLFPFILSIFTFVVLSLLLIADACFPSSFAGRPQFRVSLFGLLTVIWLAFNAFSSSRWRYIPLPCSVIPGEFPDQRMWCKNVHILQSFVWLEWIMLIGITVFTYTYTRRQNKLGNKHVFTTSLSRYHPRRAQHATSWNVRP